MRQLGNLPTFQTGINKGRLDRIKVADVVGFTYKQVSKAYNNWIQIFRIENSDLTFEEYLNKLKEANITPDNVNNINGYNLARFNDEGPYTKESCRFIPCLQNSNEQVMNGKHVYSTIVRTPSVKPLW